MTEISILNVEDSNADAMLIKMALRKAFNNQSSLTRVIDIASAVAFLENNKVDVILLDLNLPDAQGLDSLKQLRVVAKNIAIVLLTGCDDEQSALKAIKNGAQDYLVKSELTAQNISRTIRYSIDREKHEQEITTLANKDILTGLPNRLHCMDYLNHELQRIHREQNNLAIFFIDCDHFKMVNDLMGHAKGDEFLIGIAQNLKSLLRTSDYIARLGGDEFVIVLKAETPVVKFTSVVSDKIHRTLRQGITLSSKEVLDARCSIGISTFEHNKPIPTADQFIHQADTAMYLAKKMGGDCSRYFDSELEKQSNQRLTLLKDVQLAFNKEQFFLNYQPIFDPKTQMFSGIEALLRWKNSRGEMISPVDFIPLLEESGLIIDVGQWVLEKACQDFQLLIADNNGQVLPWVSINVSPVQLQNKKFFEILEEVIKTTGINPQSVHLEITESLFLERSEHILTLLDEINILGCKISIDDFGVGYSSMSSLKDLPVSRLKLDRSFIFNCLQSSADKAIIKAMISLAHNLQMDVVAEGIEELVIAEFLIEQKCEYLQGYYFSRPLNFTQLRKKFLTYHRI